VIGLSPAGVTLLLVLASGVALADPTPREAGEHPGARDRGKAVFQSHCAACHALTATGATLPGPTLAGVVGRPVAGDPDYDYSPVLRAAGTAGRRWDGETLQAFLADPEAMFPGLWMGGSGLRAAADRAAVVRFLANQPPATRVDGR